MSGKVGRPPVPKRDAKSVLLGVQVTPSEATGTEKRAEDRNMTKSELLRELVNTEIRQSPPPPKWFKSSLTEDALNEMSGKTIEFTLTRPGTKARGIGRLLTRQNGDGEIAIDIEVIERGANQFAVTRYWLLPPMDSKIEINPDQTKARYRLSA